MGVECSRQSEGSAFCAFSLQADKRTAASSSAGQRPLGEKCNGKLPGTYSSMNSTATLICSSVNAGLPPLAGIALSPLMAF